jgi:hypothetical protein
MGSVEVHHWLFSCDEEGCKRDVELHNSEFSNVISQLRLMGWRVDEKQQEYFRGPTMDEIANKGYPGAWDSGDIKDTQLIYTACFCKEHA